MINKLGGHMRTRGTVLFVIVLSLAVSACGKPARIVGTVQDIFGVPLRSAIIKIEKSTFTANSDESGMYSIDYAPGSIRLAISRPGYTTSSIDLSIQQKVYYPVEPIVLYPIPTQPGFYYIDFDKKKLVTLESNAVIVADQRRESIGIFDKTIYSWGCAITGKLGSPDTPPVLEINPGKQSFIDRRPDAIALTRVKEYVPGSGGLNSLIREITLSVFESSENYSGLLVDDRSSVGPEGLLVRTAELPPGEYCWIKQVPRTSGLGLNNFMVPTDFSEAIMFRVKAPPSK
jgi:hypothetical protein